MSQAVRTLCSETKYWIDCWKVVCDGGTLWRVGEGVRGWISWMMLLGSARSWRRRQIGMRGEGASASRADVAVGMAGDPDPELRAWVATSPDLGWVVRQRLAGGSGSWGPRPCGFGVLDASEFGSRPGGGSASEGACGSGCESLGSAHRVGWSRPGPLTRGYGGVWLLMRASGSMLWGGWPMTRTRVSAGGLLLTGSPHLRCWPNWGRIPAAGCVSPSLSIRESRLRCWNVSLLIPIGGCVSVWC